MIYVIVDIDRTIADNEHRAKDLEKCCDLCGHRFMGHLDTCPVCASDLCKYTQSSFDSFLDAKKMLLDVPIVEAQRVLNILMNSPTTSVSFITGRKSKEHRIVTEQWLKVHFGFDNTRHHLMMREFADLDTRASDFKERAFLKLKNKLKTEGPFLFFDDDPYVWTMYRKYGMVLKAPEAWESFMPKGMNRLSEPLYNK